MVNYTNVSARAMLVNVAISMWTGYKMDKKATKQVNDANKAGDKAGRYNKQLLPGCKVFEDLNKRSALARDVHYRQTLPWSDEGWRLLPSANFFEYSEAVRAQFRMLDALLAELVENYDDLVNDARKHFSGLGEMFDIRDYPKKHDLPDRFSWNIEIGPVPSANDIRVDLPKDTLSLIETQITDRVETATRQAMQEAWGRVHEAVARIHKAATGIKRDNLFDHAKEVIDRVGRLNIGNDEHLDAFCKRIDRELTSITVDDLRKDERLQADTAQRAADIMKAMESFYTPFTPDNGSNGV